MDQDIQHYTDIVAATAFWITGRWLMGLAGRMLRRVPQRQKVDPTLMLTRAA